MAKMKGILIGDASGKVGNTVAKVVAGEQIVSKYQPEVANPNTEAQVDTRSRFKLMSQLAASMKREIAIPRKGLQSGRNRFVKTNFDLVSYEGGAAAINLNKVQLTDSRRPLGTLSVDRSSGTAIQCSVAVKPALYEKVIVCNYRKSDDDKLVYVGSSIADVDASGTTVLSLPYTSDAVVTYAYGIAYSSAAARTKYGNLEANPAQQIASLVQSSSATAGAARFSKTIGCTMLVGANSTTTIPFNFNIESFNGTTPEDMEEDPSMAPQIQSTNNEIATNISDWPTGLDIQVRVSYWYKNQNSSWEKRMLQVTNVRTRENLVEFDTPASVGVNTFAADVEVQIDGTTKVMSFPRAIPEPIIISVNGILPGNPLQTDVHDNVIIIDADPALTYESTRVTIIEGDDYETLAITNVVRNGNQITFDAPRVAQVESITVFFNDNIKAVGIFEE